MAHLINYIEVHPNDSDEALRAKAQIVHSNGEYTIAICRSCGMTWHNPDGDWKTAKVLKGPCSECCEQPL